MHPSPTNTVIRITAMLACALLGAMLLIRVGSFGPQLIPYIRSVITMLAGVLAGEVADSASAGGNLKFWLVLLFGALSFGIFAAAFLSRTNPATQRSARMDTGLLLTQLLIALLVERGLLFIVALELALVLPRRTAFIWFAAMALAQFALHILNAMFPAAVHLVCHVAGVEPVAQAARRGFEFMDVGIDIVWQAFSFCGGYIASSEQRSRHQLAAELAKLVATQQLLADALRASERARVAANLNDVLGRNLNELSVQLDRAAAGAGGHVLSSIRTSQELAQRLLGEVREVARIDSNDQAIDLGRTLQILCAGIPYPRVVLSFDDLPEINSPVLAHTIFCSVQESITNAVRHSGASVLHVTLFRNGNGVAIAISDNGKGRQRGEVGNGLRGIRERVEELDGTLATGNLPDGGFSLQIWLPLSGGAQ